MDHKIKTAGLIAFAAVFFIIDRALKWLFANLWLRADFKISGDRFGLKLSLNQGVAFGWPVNTRLIIILTCLALFVLVYLAWLNYRQRNFFVFFAWTIVIAGAYSNLLDRLQLGAVVDYFSLQYFSVFNLADVMITLGIAAIILYSFRQNKSMLPPSSNH